MEDALPVPGSISHRQLQALLQNAAPDPAAHDPGAAGDKALQQALAAWHGSSLALLEQLQGLEHQSTTHHSRRQLMALGALQAHVAMGLQALAHSRRSQG
jgi:hypothetical protein